MPARFSAENKAVGNHVQAYPPLYQPKDVRQQNYILQQSFPFIGCANVYITKRKLPANAEGWFAIPKWENIAPTYGEAVEKMIAAIKLKRKIENCCGHMLESEYLRQNPRTTEMFKQISQEQKDYNVLVVPAQFGLYHKGRSIQEARQAFAPNEFGLGAFAVASMLLTHPERETRWEQIHIDCAGDEFTTNLGSDYLLAPSFFHSQNSLKLYSTWIVRSDTNYGSASAFLM